MKKPTTAIFGKNYCCILLLALFFAGSAHAQKAISFLANVQPDSDQTFFSIKLNDQTITSAALNDMLRPGGGSTLRVTSIHGLLIDSQQAVPDAFDYAVVFIGAITPRASVRGFGAGTISVSGPTTTQINFDPGLFVNLDSDETLTLRSQIQSNQLARIEVHGFLETD